MTLTVFHGNIAGARDCDHLLTLLAVAQPDVAVLTEAYHWAQDVPGYELVHYSAKHGPEARDVAVLVRHGVTIARRRLKKLAREWWGPFTLRKRQPRRYVRLGLDKDGVRWPLEAVHYPPGGPSGGTQTRGRNRAAWHESARSTRRWLRLRVRAVAVGDFNANGAALRKHVAPKGARVVMASNVDGVAAKGCHVTVKRLTAPARMHGWFIATLREEAR